ncbi:uncharacterized protein F4822DRAFT_412917 [Hypoxylon trugodes]|uniref:uncharacterized protein n=1 Tax=Hypoxylon trugodes TaxID=326681 RepID=UPI0021A03FB9|nr:uncharacterized protein F4822DRAFT_412917 [Hypoxylon trugodes]KAI1385385.1 hypothetical protein F4822DRAFT_412917 [Hypoxylon trugodes]
MSSSTRSWECVFPGCGKRFSRKEHLNRHALVHNPEHQYKCQICGRRYARSDVFKRHVKQHNPEISQTSDNRSDGRSIRICLPCGQRNTHCDGNSPCGACVASWTECRWIGTGNNANNHEANAGQMTAMLPGSSGQAPWLSPTVDSWNSRQFQVTPLYPTIPSDLSGDQPMQDITEPVSFTTPVSSIGAHIVEPITYDTSSNSQISPQSASVLGSRPQTNSASPMPPGLVTLEASLDRDSPTTKRLIQTFLTVIHPYWPILHEPTFDIDKCPTILTATILILASWLENGPEHQKLAPLVFDEVNRIRMDLHPRLYFLQAVLLYVVYATCTLTSEGMVAKALNLTGLLISTCRYLGVFNGQYTCRDKTGDVNEFTCPFIAWRVQEQLNRLAFSVLRVDAYLSVLLDHPPSLRYQELCIPLPKSEQLWAAATEEERRKLQWNEPAGREKALFSFFMRDSLDPTRVNTLPYFLTDIDHHLNACATQTHVWEAAREAHSSMSDELVKDIDPLQFVQFAHPHLARWDKRKQGCDAQERYFTGCLPVEYGEHQLAPLTFTLMHVSTLKLNAPLNVLRARGHYYKSRPGAAIPTRKPQAHLQTWIKSGAPRTALWNAAKICRIFAIESMRPDTTADPISILKSRARLRLNPLLTPGVLMSAVVACSYARYTRSCANCRRAAEEAEHKANASPCCPQLAAKNKQNNANTSTTTNISPCAASTNPQTEADREKDKEKEDDPIDLFTLCDNDPALERWKQRGIGIPYWGKGEERIPVCMCRLSDVAAWFRGAFVEDEGAEMEFVIFLAELSREGE